MPFKDLEQKHNLVNMVILACGKRPTDADINPLLEEMLERFYEDAVIEGMAKQMHSSVDRAVNAMGKGEQFEHEMSNPLNVILGDKPMTIGEYRRKRMHDKLDNWIDGVEE